MGKYDMPIALSAIPVGMAASILGYRAAGGKDINQAELAAQLGMTPGLLGTLAVMGPMGKRHTAKLDKKHTLEHTFSPAQFDAELAKVQDPKKNPVLMGITNKKKLREAQSREAKNLFLYQRNKKLRAQSLDKVVEQQTKRIPRRYLASMAAAGLTGAAIQKGLIDSAKMRKRMKDRNRHYYPKERMEKEASTLLKVVAPIAGASYGYSGYGLSRDFDKMRGIPRKDEDAPDRATARRAAKKGFAAGLGGVALYEGLKAGLPRYVDHRSKKVQSIIDKLSKNMRLINPKATPTPYQFRDEEVSGTIKERPDGSKGRVHLNKDGTINFEKSKQPRQYRAKGPKPKAPPAVVVNPKGMSMKAFGAEYKKIKDALTSNQALLKKLDRLPAKFNYYKPAIGGIIGLASLGLAHTLGAYEGRKQRK